jgi:hypothetical protein
MANYMVPAFSAIIMASAVLPSIMMPWFGVAFDYIASCLCQWHKSASESANERVMSE